MYVFIFLFQLRDNDADIGVANYKCSYTTTELCLCSPPFNPNLNSWVSGAPRETIPATNLFYLFTPDVWLYIFLTMFLFGGFLKMTSELATYYKINTESYDDFLVPFRSICS